MLEKTFDPKTAEPRISEAWERSGAFQPERALARDPAASPFCMVIPPPNVTGSLHVGHALNNTLQDILARYHRMKGDAVLWLPGTDHAGIATQMVVERQLAAEGNVGRRELGREAFVERIWGWKAQSGGTITGQLRRLGASCDWSRERFTLDEGLSAAVRKVFVELYDKGRIYRDKRLVNWDPHFQTAISDLEVEMREEPGEMWRFAYPLEDGVAYQHPVAFDADGRAMNWETRNFIEVATTRPETMLGDTAVAVHPDDARYRDLIGKRVRLPIVGRSIPIIADAYADPVKGSGAVKITPAHDFNDFEVAKRHNLAAINILDPFGKLNELGGDYEGMTAKAARNSITVRMDELGLLRGIDPMRHVVPRGDRSGVVIEPFLTDQWYVDAKTLAKPAIAAMEDGSTVFEPRNWERTYFEWMRNIEPWCISRQLWWGHRIPAWYGPRKPEDWTDAERTQFEYEERVATKVVLYDPRSPKIFVADGKRELQQQLSTYYGDDVLVNLSSKDWRKSMVATGPRADAVYATSASILTAEISQDEDVLDTWFSSALWSFSTLGWPEQTDDLKRFYPTSTLVTGFDIIFFWVARMMMMGLEFMGEVPFRRVVINGLVRDERGQKMSKSKGNVIDPLEVIEELGADALRFSLTILSGARDIKLSKSRIEGYRNFGTKLWNAARFCQMNECVSQPGFDPAAARETLNRWIYGQTVRAAQGVTEALEAARFDEAASVLYRFIWNVFCDWYVELAKPILNGDDEAAKAETRAMAAWTLDQALCLLHPISPFITEALWAQTAEFGPARASLLIETPWPQFASGRVDVDAEAEIDWLIGLVTEIRSARAEMTVAPSARMGLTIVSPSAEIRNRVKRNRDRLCSLARLTTIGEADAPPPGAVVLVAGGSTLALSMTASVDLTAEHARLEKAMAAAEQDVARVARKLDNADFLARAPAAVVDENRAKLADAQAALAKLQAAMARLETVT